MSGAVNMREAAEAAGLAYETFRKRWPALVAELGFPRPLHGRRWSAEAVDAWKARRSAEAPEPALPPERDAQRRRAQALQHLQALRAA